MRKNVLLGLLSVTAILLFLCLYPIYSTLVITSRDGKQILWSAPTYKGEKFIIRYTHSVANTDVDEVIRVGRDELIIDSSIYQSFGAGLPSTVVGQQKLELKDGKLVLSNINLHQPFIQLAIGQVVANHRLIYRDQLIPLKNISPPGSSIRICLRKENLLKHIGRGLWSES